MMRSKTLAITGFGAAVLATPQLAMAKTLKEVVDTVIVPLGNTLVNLLFALCFIFFLIGMVRFFMSHSDEQRQKGKQFAVWGIIALAVLFAVWGLVNLLLTILKDIAS